MLDVHAPHERIQSWKNFFIHIVAIVVGLLITVALEQTVEFFHHRHQREELTAALQRDATANLNVSTLSAAQRATALECLRTIAERARSVMLRLVIFDAANEYIFSTPFGELDTTEAGKRYSQVFQQKLQAHLAANFAFGGY